MNIVNPTDTTHEIYIIPRFGLPSEVIFSLYNEQTQVTEIITNTFSFLDGYLTVYFDYDLPTTFDNAKVKIFNLLGQSLAEQKITQQSGKIQLPVEHLKEGVYFYSLLIDNQNVISKKLIIRR